jgi:hypothetical protein
MPLLQRLWQAPRRMALAGLRVPGVTILDQGCVAKTYPDYWRDLASLGVRLEKPDPVDHSIRERSPNMIK